jgi:lipopolysaccharide/colanic/teichoic acid biosynthesis glycosyltransferase
MAKRLFDIAISASALLLLAPLFAVIAVAILIDGGGPIFYRGKRVGKGGREFGMYKFRTMNDDKILSGPRVTAADDPRITRLGKFLRTTKINEFPQLINVIKGDMSLVGPRPEDPEFVRCYSPEEAEVLSVRPGITSPASIIYYDEERLLSFAKAADGYVNEILPRKLRMDLLYVRHHSFLLDMDVLFQTVLYFLPQMRTVVPEIEEVLFGPVHRLTKKYLPWFVIDYIVGLICILIAGIIWRVRTAFDIGPFHFLLAAAFFACDFSLTNWITGLYRTSWKRASNTQVLDVAFSATLATGMLGLENRYLFQHQIFPSGMILLGCFFSLVGFILVRYWPSMIIDLRRRLPFENGDLSYRENILIIGAGEMGGFVVRLLERDSRASNFQIAGFVDDDPVKGRTRIRGLNVLGSTRRIPQIAKDFNIAAAVFAINNIDPKHEREVLDMCRKSGIRVARIPDIAASLFDELGAIELSGIAVGSGARLVLASPLRAMGDAHARSRQR